MGRSELNDGRIGPGSVDQWLAFTIDCVIGLQTVVSISPR